MKAFNFQKVEDLSHVLKEKTGGGAQVVIDCVGMNGVFTPLELAETALRLQRRVDGCHYNGFADGSQGRYHSAVRH